MRALEPKSERSDVDSYKVKAPLTIKTSSDRRTNNVFNLYLYCLSFFMRFFTYLFVCCASILSMYLRYTRLLKMYVWTCGVPARKKAQLSFSYAGLSLLPEFSGSSR